MVCFDLLDPKSSLSARQLKKGARMVWGTFLEKNLPRSNGHLLDFGGVLTLARMVWGTYAVKIEVQLGIFFC